MGRGVIATAPLLKNEVVFDYHGIEVDGHTVDVSFELIAAQPFSCVPPEGG